MQLINVSFIMSNVLPFKASENFSTVTYRSNEWVLDASEMQRLDFELPLLIGGATTSATALPSSIGRHMSLRA